MELKTRTLKNGKKMTIFAMREIDYKSYVNDYMGICFACGELADSVEPDAEGYTCESCDKERVYGIEQALLYGRIEITE